MTTVDRTARPMSPASATRSLFISAATSPVKRMTLEEGRSVTNALPASLKEKWRRSRSEFDFMKKCPHATTSPRNVPQNVPSAHPPTPIRLQRMYDERTLPANSAIMEAVTTCRSPSAATIVVTQR